MICGRFQGNGMGLLSESGLGLAGREDFYRMHIKAEGRIKKEEAFRG
jgi:hypothetical protein